MKKLFYILALMVSFLVNAQQFAGPQKIIDVPIAAGTPDVMTRGADLITKRITFSSFASMIASSLNTTFYPFASNPAGYLTQQSVLEYADLASFPITGTSNVIYIANNTATTGVPVYYIWNGSAYVTTAQPVTGITGSGTIGRIPRFVTPTSLGNSNYTDNGTSGRYSSGSQYVEFVNSPAAVFRMDRGQSRLDFYLGNGGFGVLSGLYSSQQLEGFEIASDGDFNIRSGSAFPGSGSGNTIHRFFLSRTTGNVGIGTGTTASDRLHVSGDLRVTGAYKDSSNSSGTSGQVLSSTGTGTSWINGGAGIYLPLSGGTMAGDLQVQTVPATANSAVSRNYLDNLLTGLTWKNAVKCKTTANHSLTGTANVDGVTIPSGTRVLVASQTLPAQNGIYLSATGAWTRASDCDSAIELESSTVLVTSGTLYARTQWTQNQSISTIDTDPAGFAQVAGSGTYTNGTGLDLSANVFSINSSVVTLTGTQTLTGKTMSGASNTFSNIGQSAIVNLVSDLATNTSNIATNTSNIATNTSNIALKKSIATGNNYKWETTDSSGHLQETTVTASRAVASDSNGLPVASTTTATELGYLNGVTSSVQTQLNSTVRRIVFDAVTSTGVNNSTAETILTSYLIPANTFSANDAMNIVAARFKSGGLGGTINYKIYLNTTNSLSGAVQIAGVTQPSYANVTSKISNITYTITGGNIEYLLTSTGIDSGVSSSALTSTAFNPAANSYIIVTATCGTSNSNNARQELLYITN